MLGDSHCFPTSWQMHTPSCCCPSIDTRLGLQGSAKEGKKLKGFSQQSQKGGRGKDFFSYAMLFIQHLMCRVKWWRLCVTFGRHTVTHEQSEIAPGFFQGQRLAHEVFVFHFKRWKTEWGRRQGFGFREEALWKPALLLAQQGPAANSSSN